MSDTESDMAGNRKDDLAVRALSRLPDPALPEGMAARIKARATALPQLPAGDEVRPAIPAASPPADTPRRTVRTRWPFYAAASLAAVLLVSGAMLVGLGRHETAGPVVAKQEAEDMLPAPRETPPPQVADAAPVAKSPAPTTRPAPTRRAPSAPAPVPVMTAPADLTTETPPVEKEQLVQSSSGEDAGQIVHNQPPATPEGAGVPSPAYGPPVPSGLGITGAINGPTQFPGEAHPGSGSSSAPPPGFPRPRGPGPKR